MKNKTLASITAASLISLATVQAHADYTTYFGVNAGISGAQGDSAIRDSENASIYIGALKDNLIGFEFGYSQLGNFEGQKNIFNGELKAQAAHLALSLRGEFAFGAQVYAKVGFHKTFWEADYADSSIKDIENDNAGLTYQAGLYIPLGENIGLTGSWQIYNGIELGANQTNDIDVNAFKVGLEFVF